jgi:hypothetical protein
LIKYKNYVTEATILGSIGADDVVAGEGPNSGQLLAMAVAPERGDDGRVDSTQNGTGFPQATLVS